jgi:hypothetical protein
VEFAGVLPHAGSGEPNLNWRDTRAAPPTIATKRAKTSIKAKALFLSVHDELYSTAACGGTQEACGPAAASRYAAEWSRAISVRPTTAQISA